MPHQRRERVRHPDWSRASRGGGPGRPDVHHLQANFENVERVGARGGACDGRAADGDGQAHTAPRALGVGTQHPGPVRRHRRGPTASRTLTLGTITEKYSVVSGPIFVSAAQVHAPSDWLRR